MTLQDLTHLENIDDEAILGGAFASSYAQTTVTSTFSPRASLVTGEFNNLALGTNTLTQTNARQKALPWWGFGRIQSFAVAKD
jgi:hypothetical protein